MRSFDYHEPGTLAEALGLLQCHAGHARLMAGGTALVPLMSLGLVRPEHVIGLRRVMVLHGIGGRPDGGLELGALVTHAAAASSPVVGSYCPALRAAFGKVGTVRIRNQATLGGCLAHADPAQDPAPVLLALDASVITVSPRGRRQIPATELFTGFFQTCLDADEIVTGVALPPQPAGALAAYVKFLPRTRDDYATVSVAVWLQRDADGRCGRARIALGSVGPVPLRAPRAEQLLLGSRFEPETISAAAAAVREEVDPIADARGPADYKREMTRVWTERALRLALEAGPQTPPTAAAEERPGR
jgi:carbon-monoxide dehydrogenase medium subunit